MMLITYFRSKFEFLFLCFVIVLLASCGENDPDDADFSLVGLTPEQRQADLDAQLEEIAFHKTGRGDFFDTTTEIGGGAPAACRPEFVAQRWNPGQYQVNQFFPSSAECGRNQPPNNLKRRESIPIFWLNLSTRRNNAAGNAIGWSDDIARNKMQEATDWFATYCIDLNVKKVAVIANRLDGMRAAMTAAIEGQPFQGNAVTVESVADSLNHQLYEQELRKPRKYLLILFTDAFQNVRFGDPDSRVNRVAGNFESIPVILIPDPPDSGSTNIITHELIHGLGKVLVGQHSFAYLQDLPQLGNSTAEQISMNRKATWDEGGCSFDMGNAGRSDQDSPMRKPDTDKMDWASFWQFDFNGNTKPK
ncbi:hypothetical protein [Nitrosomonas ureae]|uniref:Uncharacterized protein n=1 Tax=Nitrosomonas ureae TaxID=44577 RepID=A0A2T5ITR6_9PROT|nr:hypothetical protein [Nitrosomonas ureae]PTQ87269.1 hypothetical protein C8R28_100629 [Nitrosomonas ureae]